MRLSGKILIYLDVATLFLVSSEAPIEEVLLGINDLPGEDVFLATGGGVFLLAGTGDFDPPEDDPKRLDFSIIALSGVRLLSLLIGRVLSTGDFSLVVAKGLFR